MPNHNIAKNTIFFISALVIQKILAFGFFVFIARVAGGASTGDYIGALSFASVFAIFLELGFSQVLIREIAKNKSQGELYLNNVISLKITLMLFIYGALFLTIKFLDLLDKNHPDTLMVMIAGVVVLVDSFVLSLQSALRGQQNLFYESLITVLSKVLIIFIGIAGAMLKFPAYIFIVAILTGSIFSLTLSAYFLFKKYNFKFKFQLDRELLKTFLKMSVPFALLGLFTNIYAQIDVVILSIIKNSQDVGLYSVPSKTLNALQFIPMAFSASLYPAMSRFFVDDKKRLQDVFEKGFVYLAMICLPLSVGIFMLAEPIIIKAYTESYRSSILALQILAPSLVFAFLTFPIGALLNATGRQKINTINMGIIMVINIVLNLILIPKMSFIGSAWAWFATNIIWFFLTIYWVDKVIDYNKKKIIISFSKSLLASLVMGLVLFYMDQQFHVLISIVLGGLVYGLLMLIIGGIRISEIKELFLSLKKSNS